MNGDPFSQITIFKPTRLAALKAWLFSICSGLTLAAVSLWIDIVAISAILIGICALCLPVIYGATSQFALIRVSAGLIGAALGLVSLWGLRYGLEFSWADLVQRIQSGPFAFIEHFMATSDRFATATTVENGRTSQGPSPTMMAWMAGTAILGMMPILGALQGPKAMQALRNMRAKQETGSY